MKCIACGTDNNLRDRTEHNGRCSNCQHPFVFEPTNMTPPLRFTDVFFEKAIADISAENTLYFTPNQFYYLLNRRLKQKQDTTTPIGCLAIFAIPAILLFVFLVMQGIALEEYFLLLVWLLGMAAVVFLGIIVTIAGYSSQRSSVRKRRNTASGLQLVGGAEILFTVLASLAFSDQLRAIDIFVVFTLNVVLGMAAIVIGYLQKSRLGTTTEVPILERRQFRDWLQRWTQVNGELPKLLPPPNGGETATVSPDISAYSFDRLIVVESAPIAQMLIANNVHLEHNAAILSITGYPQNIFSTVMEMLRRNPHLTVYALHDASPKGIAMVQKLTTDPQWFRGQLVKVIDLGLLPRQILAQGTFAVYTSKNQAQEAKRLPANLRQKLSTAELRWLEAGKFVELDAFGPLKLMQVIRMGIALGAAADGDGVSSWNGDDGGMLLASDSFG